MSLQSLEANITTVCENNQANRSEAKVASPLQLSLTDVFVGKVLTFSLRFELYLKTYFPSIFSTSLVITLEAIFPIELLSSASDDTCFKYHRTFLILSLSPEFLIIHFFQDKHLLSPAFLTQKLN